MSQLRIALYQPDIAGNAGTILRLGACLGIGIAFADVRGSRSVARRPWDHWTRRQKGWPAGSAIT